MRFDGSSGKRPSAEARRHVYKQAARAIQQELDDPAGWLLFGLVDAADRRRVERTARLVVKELLRKAGP